MKKPYARPAVHVMELRPEEKLASCMWPIGFWFGDSCVSAWKDVGEAQSFCETLYQNAGSTGS